MTSRIDKGGDLRAQRAQLEEAILGHLERGKVRFSVAMEARVTSDVDEANGKLTRYLGGCAVSVVSHDENGKSAKLFEKGFGDSNRGRWWNPPDPITPDSTFLMASSSKPITALGVLILRDRLAKEAKGDLLNLTLREIFKTGDRLHLWKMPGFGSPSLGDIRVKDLLTHTSGLAGGADHYIGNSTPLAHLSRAAHIRSGSGDDCSVVKALMEKSTAAKMTIAQANEKLDPKQSDFSPSSERGYRQQRVQQAEAVLQALRPHPAGRFSYSSAGTAVLVCVIEHLSGKSLNDFFQENVFGPLGMKSSTFIDPTLRSVDPKYAVGRRINDKGPEISADTDLGTVNLEKEWQPRTLGSAGMISSVSDLSKLSSVFEDLDNDRQAKISISPKTWKEANSYVPDSSSSWNYSGTSWSIRRDDQSSYLYHSGSWSGHGTALYRVSRRRPRCNLWISIACNVGNYRAFLPWDVAKSAEQAFCPPNPSL